MTIDRNGEILSVTKKQYSNKNIAIVCSDEYGCPYATLSVNLINEVIEKDEAFIYTNNYYWAVPLLKSAGIISANPLRFAQSGYCTYPLYKINL